MADKKLTLIVQAKNMVAQGLSAAGSAISSFASRAASAFGTVAKWFGILGSALGGFSVVKAVGAFMDAEKASNDLRQALKLNGDSVDQYLGKLSKVASELQKATGYDEEQLKTGMAAMRMYGMRADKLEEAAKGLVALTRAGMSQEQAEKALVAASEGNFQALTKFIPLLRTANSETEKAAIVNQFLNSQFAAAKGDVGTLAGSWRNMRVWIGEAMESIGELISKGLDLPALFGRVASAARKVSEAIGEWIKGPQFEQLKETLSGIVAAMEQGGTTRTEMFSALGNVIVSAFKDGASVVAEAIKNAFKDTIVGRIGGAAAAANRARGEMLTRAGVIAGGGSIAEANAQVRKEREEDSAGLIKRELPGALAEVARLGAQAEAKRGSSATDQFERTAAEARRTAEETANRTGMNLAQGPELAPGNETPEQAEKRIEALKKAREDAARKIAENAAKLGDLDKRNHDAAMQQIEDERTARMDALKKEIAQKQEIAQKTVREFVAQKKQERDAAKKKAKEDKEDEQRARQIMAQEQRLRRLHGGGKLNQSDADFIAAFRQRGGAVKDVAAAQAKLAKEEQAHLQADQAKRDQVQIDIKAAIQNVEKQQEKLLAMG